MSADTFLWLVAQALFVGVFVLVGLDAIRRPQRAKLDIAVFFGLIAAILLISDLPLVGISWESSLRSAASYALLAALPYVLLRLVDDFSPQAAALMWGALTATAVQIVSAFVLPQPWPVWFQALPEIWFLLLGGYASLSFIREGRRTRGVTSRRMLAVAVGSGMVGLVLLLALVGLVFSAISPSTTIATRLFSVVAGLAYFVGFWPPAVLRRAWQEPELRAFLERAASLPRLPETIDIVHELERGASESTGAPAAVIGLWDADRQVLVYHRRDGTILETGPTELVGGQIFSYGPQFIDEATQADPRHADLYRATGARAVLGAPIVAGDRRLGVLLVYAVRAPIFADDDLRLVELLADQAAVILESRHLIDTAAQVRAREEATRMKDDFLSAAAHDLRSPLTTLLLHAELLQREVAQRPRSAPNGTRLDAIVHEARRLRELVSEFLDGMRAEQGVLLARREPVELTALLSAVATERTSPDHPCRVIAEGPLVADLDAVRVRQLVANLVDNAIKYSPDGGPVTIRMTSEGGNVHLEVSDLGIGIPAADLPNLFERFHRAGNVDDRRFHGLGLGLYISRGIVEEHGGRIWVTSEIGQGSTFHVVLPLAAPAPAPASPALKPDGLDPDPALMGSTGDASPVADVAADA